MVPNAFEYYCPATLEEALSLLSNFQDEAKILAGGQSLISLLKLRLANPKCLIDIGRLENLSYIRDEEEWIVVGALTTYSQIKASQLLRAKCPLLPQTAQVVADVQVRNRGTLGGSIAHADPAGDMPAAILALGAEVKAVGPSGERWIRAEDLFQGMYETALSPNEILTEIRVPAWRGYRFAYLKAARRPSDFAIAGIALRVKISRERVCEDIAIGVTGLTDKAYRPLEAEDRLKGNKLVSPTLEAAAHAITEGIDVVENMHASSEFRSHLARVYLSLALDAATLS